MEVLLVRHGRTEWTDEGRIQGWAPVPLDEVGRERADRLGAHLADAYDVDAVVSSDLLRARQTAAPIGDLAGVTVETDARLRERDFGVFQGLRSSDFFDRFPRMDLLAHGDAAAAYAPERGESWYDVESRVVASLDAITRRTGTVVVVTHVNPIRLVLGELTGQDVVTALTDRPIETCSVTRVVDGALVDENDTSFLR